MLLFAPEEAPGVIAVDDLATQADFAVTATVVDGRQPPAAAPTPSAFEQ
jgi:hypothetical protein